MRILKTPLQYNAVANSNYLSIKKGGQNEKVI
jgi:hypothetical protein